MSLKRFIEEDYKECIEINRHKYPDDMIRALKHQERVPMFLDNMCREMALVEMRMGLNRIKIKEAVYSLTEFFLNNLKRKADEDSLSDLEKRRIVTDANAMEELSREVLEEDYSRGLVDGKVEAE